ncbi:MAG: response regulator transcription factor [Oscillospiraceae bacterium]|jgi:two-component system alkaline phosphatase synthesis response regulator PhoP|nr:response regulator transcription factor [Oscillospiraceae bacterium]
MVRCIYIVEDDENIRELVRWALVSFSYEVESFENAEDALRAVAARRPDLVIFDVMLPGMSGLEAMGRLRRAPETQTLPIVLLTARTSEGDRVSGLDGGADDYIVKPFSVMELGARLRALFRRLGGETDDGPPRQITFSDFTVNHDTREVRKSGVLIDLTFKEYELLWSLLGARTRIVPREELLNTVWGGEFVGESRTLDMHIRTLRRKLGDDAEAPRYIKTVRNVGYRFIG